MYSFNKNVYLKTQSFYFSDGCHGYPHVWQGEVDEPSILLRCPTGMEMTTSVIRQGSGLLHGVQTFTMSAFESVV